MKSYIYPILLLLYGILAVQCSEKADETSIPVDPDSENENYTSYWYYSYEAVDVFTNETMGLETAEQFSPYAVAHRGDSLFVANSGTAGNSLILLNKKTNKPLKTIKTWTVKGAEKNFTSKINAIVPTADRLYVAEQQSLIHVFSLPNLEYLSCIGNGSWKGPVFQAQAITVTNGLIFAREKDGKVSVYKEADVTPENYQKINRYKRTGPGAGDSSNNGFAAHYMEIDKDGHIMLTGYAAKSIRILDPSLINDDFKDGTNIDIDKLTWTVPFNPKTFAMTTERLYATGSNDAINIYDFEQKAWIKTLKAIKGFTFSRAERIYRENDEIFWVSDDKNRKLIKMGVFKGEIREYARISDRIIEVKGAVTRHGQEQKNFFVDTKTHEIIDPSDLE